MTKSIVFYKFHAPYTIKGEINDDYLSEADHAISREILIRCLQWAVDKQFVTDLRTAATTEHDARRFTVKLNQSPGSLSTLIGLTNMRGMVVSENRKQLFKGLADSKNNTGLIATELEQLAITLSTLFDSHVIDVLITRLYRSYDAVPVAGADMTWETFHRTNPSFWVIPLIQTAILAYCKPFK